MPRAPEGTIARSASRKRLTQIPALIITGVAVVVSAVIAAPLIPALTWALALAVAANPVYERVKRAIQNPNIAAGLSVIAIAILILGPVVVLGAEIVRQSADALEWLRQEVASGRWQQALSGQPRLAAFVQWVSSRFELTQITGQAVETAKRQGGQAIRTTLWGLAQLFIALYALFYFLRDREQLVRSVLSLMPFSDKEAAKVLEEARMMIRATVYGNVLTSLLQGALAGLMFWMVGLPGALLWGFAMFLLSLVPTLGSFIVWAPAALFLALSGHWGKAAILTAWGVGVVGTIDNFVYPYLVGRDIRMHTLAVFVSLLGGLFVFGAAGLVLGPVVFSVAFALLAVMRRRAGAKTADEPA